MVSDTDLDDTAFTPVLRRLKIIPQVGLDILLLIVFLMMFAGHGL